MRHLKLVFAALVAVTLAMPALARDSVIALSSAQSETALKTQIESALQHVLGGLQPGQSAHFYDATSVTLIGTFTVPEGSTELSQRRLLLKNGAVMASLGAFLRSAQAVPGMQAKIDLPNLLRSIRSNQPAPEDGADLIVLGHPVHDPANAPSQSMLGGRVASDGHIAAQPGQSVYATQGLPGTLEGYDVYFGLLGQDWAVSPPYAYHVERFWTLSVEAHGGSMAYIGADIATLFARAGSDAPDRPHAEPLRAEEKLEMLTFASDTGAVPDLFNTPLEEAAAPEPVWRSASSVTIGITWDVEGADLDLYVRPDPSAQTIFYAQSDTPKGRLFKDFTLSPGTGFETIALKQPADLSRLQIAVNYYGGVRKAGGISGELRLAIGGEVWAVPIHVPASRGNRGVGAETVVQDGRAPNSAWILVDPLVVIGAR